MLIFKRIKDLKSFLKKVKSTNKQIGFVPTMGALHQGHMSLIQTCNEKSDFSVCSIFVNPTQFNQTADLDKYPRTLEADTKLLIENKCDVLFVPSVEEMYPEGQKSRIKVDLAGLDKILEAAHRPGHFEGVVQVVDLLLKAVEPDKLFLGQKDFQQVKVIQKLVEQYHPQVEIISCPTQRSEKGLALSSRNARLSTDEKETALVLSKSLQQIKKAIKEGDTAEQALEKARKNFDLPHVKLEYLELRAAHDLAPINEEEANKNWVALCAAWVGEIRLIDNVLI